MKKEGSDEHRKRKRKRGHSPSFSHNPNLPLFCFLPTNMNPSLTFSSTFIFLLLFLFSWFCSFFSSSVFFLFLTTTTTTTLLRRSTRTLYKVVHYFPCSSLFFPFSQVYLRLSVSTSSRFRILSHCDLGFVLLIFFSRSVVFASSPSLGLLNICF